MVLRDMKDIAIFFPEAIHGALLVHIKSKETDFWDLAGKAFLS